MFHKTRAVTMDREAAEVLVSQILGRTRSLTPEGFLLCEEVPIARTGVMQYLAGEVPLDPGTDGIINVTRDRAALFAKETIASFQGKPVTNDHPPEIVDPQNFRVYSVGMTLNPRQDTADPDLLIADLLIMEKRAIEDALAGKIEVSAGYEADYKQVGEGEGRQTNIIGNHVALVQRGRCGPRCAIGDEATLPEGKPAMAKTTTPRRVKLLDSIRAAFKDAGESLAESLSDPELMSETEPDEGANHIHLHVNGAGTASTDPAPNMAKDEADPMEPPAAATPGAGLGEHENKDEARFVALETSVAEIKQLIQQLMGGQTGDADPIPKSEVAEEQEEEAEKRVMTGDSAPLLTSFKQLVADAEILVPGFKVPTFDAKLPRAKTVDNMCSLRKSVLKSLALTQDGGALLAEVGAPADTDKLACDHAAIIFKAATATKKAITNKSLTGDTQAKTPDPKKRSTPTVAEMNKAAAEFWANRT